MKKTILIIFLITGMIPFFNDEGIYFNVIAARADEDEEEEAESECYREDDEILQEYQYINEPCFEEWGYTWSTYGCESGLHIDEGFIQTRYIDMECLKDDCRGILGGDYQDTECGCIPPNDICPEEEEDCRGVPGGGYQDTECGCIPPEEVCEGGSCPPPPGAMTKAQGYNYVESLRSYYSRMGTAIGATPVVGYLAQLISSGIFYTIDNDLSAIASAIVNSSSNYVVITTETYTTISADGAHMTITRIFKDECDNEYGRFVGL